MSNPSPPDRLQILLEAIARVSPEFAALLGERTAEFERILALYLTELETPGSRPPSLLEAFIRRHLQKYPVLHDRIMTEQIALDHEGLQPTRLRGGADLLKLIQEAPSQPHAKSVAPTAPVTRYVDLRAPRVWTLGQKAQAVSLRLTLRPNPQSVADEETALDAIPDEPVTVYCAAPDFAVDGSNTATLTVPPMADSAWASFLLTPLRPGESQIEFHLYQRGNPIGEARVSVTILAQAEAQTAHPEAAQPRSGYHQVLQFEEGTQPPDFTLWISLDHMPGETRLRHTLWRGDRLELEGLPIPLATISRYYMERLYDNLTSLAQQSLHSGSSARSVVRADALKEQGVLLWEDLLPGNLKAWLRQEWPHLAGKSLILLSDEPDIPWELVWPNMAGLEPSLDQPLAAHFRLGRWLRPGPSTETPYWLTARLGWQRWARFMNRDAGLVHVPEEDQLLRGIIHRRGVEDVTPSPFSRAGVQGLLAQGRFSWMHIATHGVPPTDKLGDGAWVELGGVRRGQADGRWGLHPTDFVPAAVKAWMGEERPGFFFNTCSSAQQHQGLTGSGGWARRLINAGAGCFLSSLWAITDQQALPFSRLFYNELARTDRPATLGNALHTARSTIRNSSQESGDPTWLAYTLFGHPNARLVG